MRCKGIYRLMASGLLAVSAAALSVSPVQACAIMPSHLADKLDIGDETALIVWDPATQTEHFIRQAQFSGNARDFGFLVPTPSMPEIAPADVAGFWRLNELIEPQPVSKPYPELVSLVLEIFKAIGSQSDNVSSSDRTMSQGAPDGVDVLREQEIAGYQVATLAAADPAALTNWLKTHHYVSFPQLKDWVKPYIQKKWVFTAFRLKAPQADASSLPLLRLSFKTEQPFYPYREPAVDPKAPPRSPRNLRLYMITAGQVQPLPESQLGLPFATHRPEALGKFDLLYRRQLSPEQADSIRLLDQVALPAEPWLTAWDHPHSTRIDEEAMFEVIPATERATFPTYFKTYPVPEPVPVPIEFVGFGGWLLWGGAKKWNSRSNANS